MNYFHRFIFVPIIYPISVPVMSSSSEPEGLIRLGRIKLPNISRSIIVNIDISFLGNLYGEEV